MPLPPADFRLQRLYHLYHHHTDEMQLIAGRLSLVVLVVRMTTEILRVATA
ncbi:MAG: hypothetical protein L0228_01350 [Planctomycetes bacterium]|nr:hypothetical protein [Planctomycetota bacterium]